jgi:LuxR family maltose regulon positive regulatory protein
MAATLLATKLFIPCARPNRVPRPRLIERLNASLAHALTLISAPAGYGKSTLVSTWAQGLKQPIAWLSLDEADNDPARFMRYLVAALQQIDPAIGRDVQGALDASPAPQTEAVIDALVNDLNALPADFVLVLDDFHTLDNADVHEAVRSLVAHQPPQMHLLIATREDPPLPLARLRAREQLVELRAHDLRFTPDEASAFLKDVMGLALDDHHVRELDARIEGWVAGLQLAALSMQKRENPAELIAGLSGSHHFILSYLMEEVLGRLPADTRTFLLETSVLDRMTGTLCDAVTGRTGSDVTLEELYASNVFVNALDDDHHWYRYHHLFADLLRNQLNRTQPNRAPALHQRASEWYEEQGEAAEAIEHALSAVDYGRTVRLLETHARGIVLQGYPQAVENWLHRLPAEWRVAGPRANLAFAWSLILRGQLDEIEPYLRSAERAGPLPQPLPYEVRGASSSRLLPDKEKDAISHQPMPDAGSGAAPPHPIPETGMGAVSEEAGAREAQAIMAEVKTLRAGLLSIRGDAERACEMAREAVAEAPPDDLYLQGMTHFFLGTTCNYAGKTEQAIEAYREALPLCRASGNTLASMLIVANLVLLFVVRGTLRAADELCLQTIETAEESGAPPSPALATVYLCHGELLSQWGDGEAAYRLVQRWLDLSKRGGHVAAYAYGSVALSRIQQARGDLAAAEAALSPAIPLLRRDMPAWVMPEVTSQQVSLALARGDTAAAWQALALTGVGIDDETSHTREVIHITYLRVMLSGGDPSPNPSPARGEEYSRAPAPSHAVGGEYGAGELDWALRLAGRVLASAEAAGRMGRVIETLALRALIHRALGDARPARNDLRRALGLAEPEGYVRLFVSEGEAMRSLIVAQRAELDERMTVEHRAQTIESRRLVAYLDKLLSAFPTPAGGAESSIDNQAPYAEQPSSMPQSPIENPKSRIQNLVEPLTEREMEVLRLIAGGLTYEEIAQRLVVSLNTVRYHVKGIYGKLGVNKRVAAIGRARAIGLL